MSECPLSSALLGLLTAGEGSPLKVEVSVTPLQQMYNRVELRYRCEVLLNLQLQDLMTAAGLRFPRRLRTTGTVEGDRERS